MNDKRCVVCGELMDSESPLSVYKRNPMTFRYAWMHYFCMGLMLEEAQTTPSKSMEYKNRLDEYFTRFA
jgi:hypothetical protein